MFEEPIYIHTIMVRLLNSERLVKRFGNQARIQRRRSVKAPLYLSDGINRFESTITVFFVVISPFWDRNRSASSCCRNTYVDSTSRATRRATYTQSRGEDRRPRGPERVYVHSVARDRLTASARHAVRWYASHKSRRLVAVSWPVGAREKKHRRTQLIV